MSFLIRWLLGIVFTAVPAWAAMILLGVAHSIDFRIPALGFFAVFFLLLVVEIAVVFIQVQDQISETFSD